MKLLIPVMMVVAVLAVPFSGAEGAGGQPVLLAQGKPPPAAPQGDALRDGRRDRSAGHEGRRSGQGALSEDDRRALRRDIDRANREIYRPRQQR